MVDLNTKITGKDLKIIFKEFNFEHLEGNIFFDTDWGVKREVILSGNKLINVIEYLVETGHEAYKERGREEGRQEIQREARKVFGI